MEDVYIIKKTNDNRSTSRKDMLIKRCKQGLWCGTAPQGYIAGTDDDCRWTLIRDPERFIFLRDMLKAIIYQTMSFGEIMKRFDDEYTTPKHKNRGGIKLKGWYSVKSILINPAYAGLVPDIDNPNIYRIGKHEPMITIEEWKILLERLGMGHKFIITNDKTA